MKLSASAFLRDGKIYIQAFSKTKNGVWIASGPVYVVEEKNSDQLGQKALDALGRSRQGVPHPTQAEWKAIQEPMLQAAGVKSWTTFAKGAKAVGLNLENDTITMEPSSDYANEGGTSLPEKKRYSKPVAQELGQALLEAFADCT